MTPRVLIVSKANIVGIYQRKLEEIARLGVELCAVVPPSWRDERGDMPLERVYTSGYDLHVLPIRLNGNFHLHTYRGLASEIARFRPHIVHIDEEPYNLAAWQALVHARRVGAKSLIFSWQNIARPYPPPFRWGERWTLDRIDYLLAGTQSAADVWREKGYSGHMRVVPQFGVDPDLFAPAADPAPCPFTVGYIGRLVEEKGIDTLMSAFARLPADAQLHIIGGGTIRAALEQRAGVLGIASRVRFTDHVPSTGIASLYHGLDALVLPSLTRPNWKEQFGRVLIEAMASGVPVVGSRSGAIPDVIGDAGLIFPEADDEALAHQLRHLYDHPAARADLSAAGRARVLAHFTHAQIAGDTVAVYHEMLSI